MNQLLATTLTASCLMLFSWSTSYAADYRYSMQVTSSAPRGSQADVARKDRTKPGTIAFTPCNDDDTLKQDVIAFDLKYDPGKTKRNKDKTLDRSSIKDVYLFFYNPNALGALADDTTFTSTTGNPFTPPCQNDDGIDVPCDPKVWAVVRSMTSSQPDNIALVPLAEASDIVATEHLYLSANENIGSGRLSEKLLRSYIRFDGLQKGVWSLTGIIATADEVDFLDPSTWAAWDTATFMLGTPWTALTQTEDDKTCK